MGMHEYRETIAQFCDEADIDEMEAILHEGLFCLDDRPVQLEYLDEQDACRVSLDLGVPRPQGEKAVYRLLLEWNYRTAQAHAPTMGLDPDSGRIVLTLVLPLDLLAESGLMDWLDGQIAPLLEAWDELLAAAEEESVAEKPQDRLSAGDFV